MVRYVYYIFKRWNNITRQEVTRLVKIPQTVLQELQATVKVDITPKGAFDKYAQEVSLENLLKAGFFNIQKLGELKIYVDLLDDDSVMPKAKLEEAIALMEEEQRKIALINAQAQIMQERANEFISGDPNQQAGMINDAQQRIQYQTDLKETAQERKATAEERKNIKNN